MQHKTTESSSSELKMTSVTTTTSAAADTHTAAPTDNIHYKAFQALDQLALTFQTTMAGLEETKEEKSEESTSEQDSIPIIKDLSSYTLWSSDPSTRFFCNENDVYINGRKCDFVKFLGSGSFGSVNLYRHEGKMYVVKAFSLAATHFPSVIPDQSIIASVDSYLVMAKEESMYAAAVYGFAASCTFNQPTQITGISTALVVVDDDSEDESKMEIIEIKQVAHTKHFSLLPYIEGITGGVFLEQLTNEEFDDNELRFYEFQTALYDALTKMGKKAFVHLDIKPDNLLIRRNKDGVLIVEFVDVGIIAKEGETITLPPGLDPQHRPPEHPKRTDKLTVRMSYAVYSTAIMLRLMIREWDSQSWDAETNGNTLLSHNISFHESMMQRDPSRRISANEALRQAEYLLLQHIDRRHYMQNHSDSDKYASSNQTLIDQYFSCLLTLKTPEAQKYFIKTYDSINDLPEFTDAFLEVVEDNETIRNIFLNLRKKGLVHFFLKMINDKEYSSAIRLLEVYPHIMNDKRVLPALIVEDTPSPALVRKICDFDARKSEPSALVSAAEQGNRRVLDYFLAEEHKEFNPLQHYSTEQLINAFRALYKHELISPALSLLKKCPHILPYLGLHTVEAIFNDIAKQDLEFAAKMILGIIQPAIVFAESKSETTINVTLMPFLEKLSRDRHDTLISHLIDNMTHPKVIGILYNADLLDNMQLLQPAVNKLFRLIKLEPSLKRRVELLSDSTLTNFVRVADERITTSLKGGQFFKSKFFERWQTMLQNQFTLYSQNKAKTP